MLTELAAGDLISFYKGGIKNLPYSEVKALRLFRVRPCARDWVTMKMLRSKGRLG